MSDEKKRLSTRSNSIHPPSKERMRGKPVLYVFEILRLLFFQLDFLLDVGKIFASLFSRHTLFFIQRSLSLSLLSFFFLCGGLWLQQIRRANDSSGESRKKSTKRFMSRCKALRFRNNKDTTTDNHTISDQPTLALNDRPTADAFLSLLFSISHGSNMCYLAIGYTLLNIHFQ